MQKLLFSVLFCAITATNYAQQSETPIGSVAYTFLHQRDTSSPKFYEENVGLVFGKHSAVYFSLNLAKRDSIMRKNIEDQMAGGEKINIDMRNMPAATQGDYFSFYNTAVYTTVLPSFRVKYSYDQPLPKINWKISDSTKEIGGLQCQQAAGAFAGRMYIAWFCAAIPASAGPWKLNGLPGLIIEAEDTTGTVKFLFQNFSPTNFYGKEKITLPTEVQKTTKEDFDKMIAAIRDNPQAAIRGMVGTAESVKIVTTQAPGANGRKRINNPLELPENKKGF